MNRHETLLKISHYEWMIESMSLRPAHENWIRQQVEELTDSLAQFHPANHPHHKCIEKGVCA